MHVLQGLPRTIRDLGVVLATCVFAQPALAADAPEPDPAPAESQARPGKTDAKTAARKAGKSTAGKIGVVRDFPEGTPDAVLREAFRCALELDDEAQAFDCYLDVSVPGNRDTATAIEHLRQYQWKQLRTRAQTYLQPGPDFALRVTRRQPGKVTAQSTEAKIFLKGSTRGFPAPVTLRRVEGRWLIYSSSL